jgi:hypothetical protein
MEVQVCPSIYGMWLPLWYLLIILSSVLPFIDSDYHFGIFWPLYYLSFHLRLVITTLLSFDHCIVCPSIYGLWLPLWYLLTIVLSVLPFTACDLWSKDTKVVMTSRKLKDRQCNDQKIPKWWSQAVNGRTDNAMVKRYQRGNHKP